MAERLAALAFAAEDIAELAAVAEIIDPVPLASFDGDRANRILGSCDVLIGHWGCPPLDHDVIRQAPRLRLFAYAAGTVKHVVTDAVWEAGVTVTTAADANAIPVAEYTLAVILLANKGAFIARERLRDRSLRAMSPRPPGNLGKRVGVIGASRVGRHLIQRLKPFDLEVVVADPFLSQADATELDVKVVDLPDLLATSDVVTLHAPDLPSTKGMIGARQLSLLRDGTTFINTARPALVDQDALEAELATGRIYAVLDVTEPEPLPADAPLLRCGTAFVTPHLAGSQGSELRRLARAAIAEVDRFARGLPPLFPVLRSDLEVMA